MNNDNSDDDDKEPSPKVQEVVTKQISEKIEHPSTSIEFQGLRDLPKPLQFELTLLSTHLNIDRDSVMGTFKLKDVATEMQTRITSVLIELI
jgi:hypothetical protein